MKQPTVFWPRKLVWRVSAPVFITSYTGKEVLFFYLAGVLARLVGPGVFSLRLTAAFVGLLTIAVTYRLGTILLRDRRLALLAASLLAISFWHLLLSRLGFRAITQPLLQGLTMWGIWRGLQVLELPGRRAWPWALLGGIALGLTAYTYLAARIFPLLLLLALLPNLLSRKKPPRLLALPLAQRRRRIRYALTAAAFFPGESRRILGAH